MSIQYAYCQEVDRVIDIVEAHEIYFAKAPAERKRLTFLCPDRACRDAVRPTITGVNYDKLPQAAAFVQKPHFRFASGQPHAPGCPWCELVAAIEEFDCDPRKPRVANLKRSELVSAFNPVDGAADAGPEHDHGQLRDVMAISDPQRRRTAIRDYLNRNLTRTTRLHEVARCFEAMSDAERANTPLAVAGVKKTYRLYFAGVRFCTPEHYYNRIYHGRASVRRYRTGYSIRFAQWAGSNDGTQGNVSVFVRLEQLRGFRGGALLTAALDEAFRVGGDALYCYVYGAVERKVENGALTRWIDVVPDSLHSLAVTLMENGENQVST